MPQRRGFLGLKEFCQAFKIQEQAKKDKKLAARKRKKICSPDNVPEQEKRSHSKEVLAWEKANKDAKKGTSWYWSTKLEVIKGFFIEL